MQLYRYSAAMLLAAGLTLPGCIDEETPTDVVSAQQVQKMSDTQRSMLYGIASFMVAYNTWGGADYYTNDWGFPCQMYLREVCGEDFPVYKSTYDYWTYHENGSYTDSYTIYGWYYYYSLIHNCNNLLGAISLPTASQESKRYYGSALAFRAMAYLDLARSYEFRPTGVEKLDTKAKNPNVWGLTVPIVTESTTSAQGIDNPRADFETMYSFILNDLEQADSLLANYNPTDPSLPGYNVVQGLKARAWMEIGSRLETTNMKLAKDANEAYTKAYECAKKAMTGYSPVTEEQWHDSKTGFNTANQGWLWRCRIGGKEQQPVYYCSFLGQTASEPISGLAFGYDAYRCIGSYLYSKIDAHDWRKTTWVDPADAGRATRAIRERYQTLLDSTQFRQVPAYANLKFRPGEGNIDDIQTWLNGDLPVMRVEEMYFIAAEALARTQGYAEGLALLQNFIQTYRYNGGSYNPQVDDFDSFIDEMMLQKRIEFWGEGICFFDYKRLNLQVDRSRSTNVEDAFQLTSVDGYCPSWMNYFIPKSETQRNTACIPNPDATEEE